ncbi:MAG: hypothetical protein U9N04_02045 [Patescibacteria group bacterium]|nr:hypothetical protein [Patescibacteria group bacterium]
MMKNSFDEIKRLMKIIGGKVVIVENGKPTMVIINVDEYIGFEKKDNLKNSVESDSLSDKKLIEKINKNINIWRNRQEERKLKQLEEGDYKKTEESFKNYKERKKDNNNEEIVIEKL